MKAIRFINQSDTNKRIRISSINPDTVKGLDGQFPNWMVRTGSEIGFCLAVAELTVAPVILSAEVIYM